MSNLQHGMTGSRLHNIWRDMLKRCTGKGKYVAKGITVCDEWKSFPAFRDWSFANNYQGGNKSINRIRNEEGYSPGNCEWTDDHQQARNRSTTRYETINGQTRSLAEWCDRYNMDYARVNARINKLGWTVERALTQRGRSA